MKELFPASTQLKQYDDFQSCFQTSLVTFLVKSLVPKIVLTSSKITKHLRVMLLRLTWGAFFWVIFGMRKIGSQTIVRSWATLIPEWL